MEGRPYIEACAAVDAQVLDALYLSKQTFQKIQQNLCWAFAYNVIALPLAAGAFLRAFGLALTPSISGEHTNLVIVS